MANPKVSVVQYLNTAPLVWGMVKGEQQGKYDLEYSTPATCADAVRQRKVDVGIVPSIEYQRLEKAQIIAGISIASKGEVKSVLLLSNKPIEKVQSIAADNSSRTSAALVRIVMRKFYSRFVNITPAAPKPDTMLKNADGALIIGDPALTYAGKALHVYDLAAEWKKFTGLPFVFAVWAGYEEAMLSHYRKDFEQSRDYGLAHVDEIAAEFSPRLKMTPESLKVYLTQNIDYSLDEDNRKGLREFYRLARETGLIPVEKDLYFT
jgi:chorismate dehydratase